MRTAYDKSIEEFDEKFQCEKCSDYHILPEMLSVEIKPFIKSHTKAIYEDIMKVVDKIHTKHYLQEHFNPVENEEHRGYRKAQVDITAKIKSKIKSL